MGIFGPPGRPWTYHILHRKWPRVPRTAMRWLMLVEFIGLIPLLVITALSQPNLYRTALWQIGWDHRLNSNPAIILYAYANYTAQPKIAFIWSQKSVCKESLSQKGKTLTIFVTGSLISMSPSPSSPFSSSSPSSLLSSCEFGILSYLPPAQLLWSCFTA